MLGTARCLSICGIKSACSGHVFVALTSSCVPSQQYETIWILAPQTWVWRTWALVAPPLPSVPSQPPGFSQMNLTFLLSLKVWRRRPVCHHSDKASPGISLPLPPLHHHNNNNGNNNLKGLFGEQYLWTNVFLPTQAYLQSYDSCVTICASASESLSPQSHRHDDEVPQQMELESHAALDSGARLHSWLLAAVKLSLDLTSLEDIIFVVLRSGTLRGNTNSHVVICLGQ